jgi:FAD/FMN-containing dehydrogenase/Fe-S oxidoreductase
LKSALQKLAARLDGELYWDAMIKSLYATDASVYRVLPMAVALPKHVGDIKTLIRFATKNETSLIPRAAGTSLAGQCVGDGIIVDISKYMNQVLEINPVNRWVRVQPGVVRDELNTLLKPYGLFFGPNTATANRSTIGGMVGNNSCGSTSIVYGSTRDHVLALKTVLSDGSEVDFMALDDTRFQSKRQGDSLESSLYGQIQDELSDTAIREQIARDFPKSSIRRRNTGYAIDILANSSPFDDSGPAFNFCKMLCGSEGTLGFTTEIKLNLVPLPPPEDVVIAAHFESIADSLEATVRIMNHGPSACELLDRTILDCTKDQIEHKKNRFFLEGDPKALLLIEFRRDDLEASKELATSLIDELKAAGLGYAFPILSRDQTRSAWDLRKAGLGLLANIPGDKKAVACVEDTAVVVEDLPAYIKEFTAIMESYKQETVYYAHAGAGELHLRPILDLKKSDDIKSFRGISEASARLVKSYQGSLSGEHGDGRVRSEFISLVLGKANYELISRIKNTWDPSGIFNPGKIVDPSPMDTHFRYETDVETPDIDTVFNFSENGGILLTVEKCNGSGDCRKLNFAGGTMCPSYRATRNEKDTTRGRANVLREFLTRNVKQNPFDHPEIMAAMELCISCKGCKSECPSNIDMATLKSEFLHQYYKDHKVPFRSKVIANLNRINTIAQVWPGLFNALIRQPWLKSALGLARERTLPELQGISLKRWYNKYATKFQGAKSQRGSLYFFCDEYTNYYDSYIGIKAIKLLSLLGYKVFMLDHPESGRGYISKGLLSAARDIAIKNVAVFGPLISEEVPLIGIEPSAILGFRDEYPNLVPANDKQGALELSNNTLLIEEFISREIDKGKIGPSDFTSDAKTILLHGHCHQKALSSTSFTEKMLTLPINYKVKVIASGCCGMAGSFGYEREHYALSNAIGEMVLFPSVRQSDSDTLIAAPGTSCRYQIMDGTGRMAMHPAEILFEALRS